MNHSRATSAVMPAMIPATLKSSMATVDPHWHSDWAWDHYKDVVARLSRDLGLTRFCEIGGGRDPLFTPEEVAPLGIDYTVNDISARELEKAPQAFRTACFDIAGDLSAAGVAPAQYDLMFSRMVFEHVRDVEQAWTNIHTLLAPGGVALAFFPTLYALPFVANHLMPEWLSGGIVKAFYANRGEETDDPKFPAVYDWCFSSEERLKPMLQRAGFTEIHIQPFWGHRYFLRLPVVRQIDEALNALAARNDIRALTSYAYVLVRT